LNTRVRALTVYSVTGLRSRDGRFADPVVPVPHSSKSSSGSRRSSLSSSTNRGSVRTGCNSESRCSQVASRHPALTAHSSELRASSVFSARTWAAATPKCRSARFAPAAELCGALAVSNVAAARNISSSDRSDSPRAACAAARPASHGCEVPITAGYGTPSRRWHTRQVRAAPQSHEGAETNAPARRMQDHLFTTAVDSAA
jgi:hypothetical protein